MTAQPDPIPSDTAPPPPPPYDVAPADAAAPAPLPAVAPAVVRFCRTCGRAWDLAWTECPHCAPRPLAPGAPSGSPASTYAADMKWVKSSLALYFSLLAVCVVALCVNLATGDPSATAEMVTTGALSLVTLAWCVSTPSNLFPVLGRLPRPTWFLAAIACACGTYLAAAGLVSFLHRIVELPSIDYLDPFEKQGFGFVWAVLVVCVQPAVFEELAFRGFVQGSLQRVLGPYEALFVQALMFAILHLSMPSFPHLLLIGVALGWLRLKTGSLYPGMLMHFTHNFLVIWSERHGGGILPW